MFKHAAVGLAFTAASLGVAVAAPGFGKNTLSSGSGSSYQEPERKSVTERVVDFFALDILTLIAPAMTKTEAEKAEGAECDQAKGELKAKPAGESKRRAGNETKSGDSGPEPIYLAF